MPSIENNRRSANLRAAIAMLCAAAATHAPARAMAAADAAPAEDNSLDEVIVTGSRTSGLKAADSPAPVQLFSAEALQAAAGSPDLQNALAQLVPSLTLQAFGSDMAGQTLQTKIRGLSPNHVLVLINGKRRHTTANIAINPESVYQGGAAADLNFIPLDAIDHIEVLTDGAAAQYGTDAIAGVINIILKKNNSGGNLNGTWGNYFDTGGNTNDVAGNAGFEPTDGSYLSITGDNRGHGHSFSGGGIDERVINPAIIGTYPNSNILDAPGYPYVNRIMGDGEQHIKTFVVNTGVDFEGGTEVYAFGTYGEKNSASYENTRLPSRISYTAGGTTSYLYPFGFEPEEESAEKDSAETVGIKGAVVGWNWDVSSTYGVDHVKVYTDNSGNPGDYALTGTTPTDIYDGFQRSTQWTSNIDINKNFDVGLAGPLNVAFGAEYRRESFQIGAGQPASYQLGGGQSFAGFSPTDAGSHGRKNEAGYVDLALKPIPGLQIDAAGRYEHYSDFGDAKVGKVTARYDFTPEFALRGTVSNGFRAPTLAEEYYSSTNVGPSSAFVQLPPNSVAAKQLGLNGLQPEHSVNLSLGGVWRPIEHMFATLDVYQIQVTNRIVGSGTLYGDINGNLQSAAVNNAIKANGNVLDQTTIQTGETGIEIFANGTDTITRGADLVFDFPMNYDFGKIDYSIGATYNKTRITKLPSSLASIPGQGLYDLTAVSDLTTANPLYVLNFGALYSYDKISVNLVEKIYGSTLEYSNTTHTSVAGALEYFPSQIGVSAITNLDVSYQILDRLQVSAGATNLFNKFPNKLNGQYRADVGSFIFGNNASASPLPPFSPYGINGGFYYVKARFKW